MLSLIGAVGPILTAVAAVLVIREMLFQLAKMTNFPKIAAQ